MPIEDEIVEWGSSRPQWQRMVLRRVARGEAITSEDISALVDRMIGDRPDPQEALSVGDLPARTDAGPSVRLLEIRDAKNLNALLQDQPLTFEPTGLTLIYGDNGSGKSGYARLIKQLVRARHDEPILSDIFTDRGTTQAAAKVAIQIDERRLDFRWPDEVPPEVARIAFFDEACGDLYLTTESEVTYRPSALFVFDGLIQVCDRARRELHGRIAANVASASQLPTPHDGTQAKTFLSSLSAHTTDAQVEMACNIPPDIKVQIERLASEEVRLRATDPTREKERLRGVASKLSALAIHLDECERVLGEPAIAALATLHESLALRNQAADLASARSFDGEPLRGVGTAAWRELWEVARRFATHSCPGEPFPPAGPGARCPLCQQELDESASDRLSRFEAFVRDVTQRELEAATQELRDARTKIEDFTTKSPDILTALEGLTDAYQAVANEYRAAFERYASRRSALLVAFQARPWERPSLDPPLAVVHGAYVLAEQVRNTAAVIDDSTFAETLRRTTQERLELEAARALAAGRDAVFAELQRLKAKNRLEEAKDSTNTQGISKKAVDLTREYVTTVIRDRFTRESDRLRLERVTLEDVGGKKGTLQHQPAFVGAVQPALLPKVLSEGEQTALGLAGFFTEAHFEQSKSAVVLDDPVSSLDHVRRGYVAARLATLARERQVVVFTHDISLIADLRLAAESEGVQVCDRSIERRRSGQPGACLMTHPWKAKDAAQRLSMLEQELARIRREMNDWDEQRYEQETSDWAGRLSETWERIINLEVVAQLVDRGTQEVRPRMFKVLVRVTEEDDRAFQASYAHCSRWARRHDKSIEVNYVPPTPNEMAHELTTVRHWWERVRKYRQ